MSRIVVDTFRTTAIFVPVKIRMRPDIGPGWVETFSLRVDEIIAPSTNDTRGNYEIPESSKQRLSN